MVGCCIRSLSVNLRPKVFWSPFRSWKADRESPPQWKKLSSTLTLSRERTSFQMAAIVFSVSVRGATVTAGLEGPRPEAAARALRSVLPLAESGMLSRRCQPEGTM